MSEKRGGVGVMVKTAFESSVGSWSVSSTRTRQFVLSTFGTSQKYEPVFAAFDAMGVQPVPPSVE